MIISLRLLFGKYPSCNFCRGLCLRDVCSIIYYYDYFPWEDACSNIIQTNIQQLSWESKLKFLKRLYFKVNAYSWKCSSYKVQHSKCKYYSPHQTVDSKIYTAYSCSREHVKTPRGKIKIPLISPIYLYWFSR